MYWQEETEREEEEEEDQGAGEDQCHPSDYNTCTCILVDGMDYELTYELQMHCKKGHFVPKRYLLFTSRKDVMVDFIKTVSTQIAIF